MPSSEIDLSTQGIVTRMDLYRNFDTLNLSESLAKQILMLIFGEAERKNPKFKESKETRDGHRPATAILIHHFPPIKQHVLESVGQIYKHYDPKMAREAAQKAQETRETRAKEPGRIDRSPTFARSPTLQLQRSPTLLNRSPTRDLLKTI